MKIIINSFCQIYADFVILEFSTANSEPQTVNSKLQTPNSKLLKKEFAMYQVIIDYCAGNGGKTLALAAMLQNQGQVPRRIRYRSSRSAKYPEGHTTYYSASHCVQNY
jgi:hypothetical protein